jgi:hypothetical protein
MQPVRLAYQPPATSQQYFSLTTNQPPTTSQQYFFLRTNQHQPSATSQTNRLMAYYHVTPTPQLLPSKISTYLIGTTIFSKHHY